MVCFGLRMGEPPCRGAVVSLELRQLDVKGYPAALSTKFGNDRPTQTQIKALQGSRGLSALGVGSLNPTSRTK